jgi:single-stranded-DNA-specific exonuclease
VSQTATRAFRLEPYDYAEARALMAALDLAEPVAVTLVRRGYRTAEAAREFLEAADDHDPFAFAAMAEVVERIEAAIAASRRITVHGDYDVDGVCSTAILVRALREREADCDWLIPGRLEDGYGLTEATVSKLAARGTSLLITVDCGIGSIAEVDAAQRAGMEVIVSDHHQPGEQLPDCPILHPAVSGYPFSELCATAVAYKLACALRGAEAVAGELDLVALATVADLVPLRGENRALVRRGLAEARRARRPGLRALMASASLVPERLDEGAFAFRLGPRINAAGRLYRADAAVELMLTESEERATEIAAELERANHERREVEREVTEAAERARRELPDGLGEAAGLVVAGEGWHAGVVGIVASRLVERHNRPAILIGLDAEGRGRGSGRSVPGFDLLAALDACRQHLGRYGGHRAAAGLEIDADRVDAFRRDFAEYVAATMPEEARVRTELVDAVVGGESLGHDVAEQLTRLGPFGMGNPGVRLLVAGASVGDVRPMGEGERHARFSLRSGGARALGVAFGVNGSLATAAGAGPLDVSVRLELNEWNGSVEPRVVLGELYDADAEAAADSGEAPAETEAIATSEFWQRVDRELERELGEWPPALPGVARRERIDRRGASGVATIAALASSGEAVLAVCADAIRRRALVERAARPARFGGGEVAVVSARLSDAHIARAEARVTAAGCGVVLADWGALARDPALVPRFKHVVVIDPAPFAHLDRLCEHGEGYLHRVAGDAEREFALRVHTDDWPSRASLATLYRALGTRCAGGDAVDAAVARDLLCGEGRAHPLAPEIAARSARVLAELGLVAWDLSGTTRQLRVVSSEGTALERSQAFVAYRDRYEEGKRFLSERRQN